MRCSFLKGLPKYINWTRVNVTKPLVIMQNHMQKLFQKVNPAFF